MFVHHHSLEHVLHPENYSSQEFWELEQTHLIRNSWQFVGFADDLAEPNAFVACDIGGVPVVVRNFDGQLRAFKNVCAHRHSRIVQPGCGMSATLKCGYHGWEYGSEGQLTKMTDGKSFKGFKAEGLCLQRYRVEKLGQMVFVNLSKGEVGFAESLGTYAAEFEQFFGNHRLIHAWTTRHNVNWKIIEENAIESYHVPEVHPKTFGNYLAEDRHEHTLKQTHSRYADTLPWGGDGSLVGKAIRLLTRLTVHGAKCSNFIHVHLFPNTLLYYTELLSTFQVVRPIGPEESEYTVYFLAPKDLRIPMMSRLMQLITLPPIVARLKKIFVEDVDAWQQQHAGLKNSSFKGVLSCREERVNAFQQYVNANMPERASASAA